MRAGGEARISWAGRGLASSNSWDEAILLLFFFSFTQLGAWRARGIKTYFGGVFFF